MLEVREGAHHGSKGRHEQGRSESPSKRVQVSDGNHSPSEALAIMRAHLNPATPVDTSCKILRYAGQVAANGSRVCGSGVGC